MQQNKLQSAIKALKAGELVITPTECVYGIVADAHKPEAIKKLFAAKQRQLDHSLTVHIAKPEDVHDWAIDIPKDAQQLMQQHWPGALTVVLKKAAHVSALITGGKNTVGIRCPNHPIAHELIKQMGHGLIMSSANISGQASPVTAEEANAQLGKQVAEIIDDGPCKFSLASTVIDFTVKPAKILRQGSVYYPNFTPGTNNTPGWPDRGPC